MKTKVQQKTIRETADFSGHQIHLGMDVHKKNWSISVFIGDIFYQTFHQESEVSILKSYLQKNFPGGHVYACYEAGFCGFSLQRELSAIGVECMVVNPSDVPQTNKGAFSKTDALDSKRLGLALAKNMLTPIFIPDEELESDRQLLRYRNKIQNLLQAKRKMLKSLFMTSGIKIPKENDTSYWTNRYLLWVRNLRTGKASLDITIQMIADDVEMLRKRLLLINRKIRELSRTEKYSNDFKILTSTPGIGLITAMTLLTEVGEITRFESFSKFNSFVGLYPSEFSSGEKILKGKLTYRSHKKLRSLIIEAAWISIRTDPALTLKYTELIQTKTKKRAIVIIARKLLSRIYSLWTKKQMYEKGIIK